ncbi:hypothetical protein PYCCODRAFT_620734 [Trametes coccinea BRFM310]|uniref:Uncharacterized protein n=1 Tax=Trametes coccinea (strain BRFM310) TaxID=1353009 RepID=A0A1Y2J271_TRAC3|nr:hypothetical protein PYCCODRAFT_620734 [Trametes coccinea BRFM310]
MRTMIVPPLPRYPFQRHTSSSPLLLRKDIFLPPASLLPPSSTAAASRQYQALVLRHRVSQTFLPFSARHVLLGSTDWIPVEFGMRLLEHCSAYSSPTQARHPRSSSSGRRRSRSTILGVPDIPYRSGLGDRFYHSSTFGCLGRSVVCPLICSPARIPRLLKLDVSVVFVWSETFTAGDPRHSRYPPFVRLWRSAARSTIASDVLSST